VGVAIIKQAFAFI